MHAPRANALTNMLLIRCVIFLNSQSEGIFRVPGNAESMSRLKANIDALSLTEIPETLEDSPLSI